MQIGGRRSGNFWTGSLLGHKSVILRVASLEFYTISTLLGTRFWSTFWLKALATMALEECNFILFRCSNLYVGLANPSSRAPVQHSAQSDQPTSTESANQGSLRPTTRVARGYDQQTYIRLRTALRDAFSL